MSSAIGRITGLSDKRPESRVCRASSQPGSRNYANDKQAQGLTQNHAEDVLNAMNDGTIAVPSDGAWTGGAAVEVQATRHVYLHAVTADTEGSQQGNLKTLADRK
jgi:hypothetical protein